MSPELRARNRRAKKSAGRSCDLALRPDRRLVVEQNILGQPQDADAGVDEVPRDGAAAGPVMGEHRPAATHLPRQPGESDAFRLQDVEHAGFEDQDGAPAESDCVRGIIAPLRAPVKSPLLDQIFRYS